MNMQLTGQELGVLQQTLDVALKQVGLQGLYTIVELVGLLENPTNEPQTEQGPFEYTLTEEHVQKFNAVFDIAIKAVGINGATNIVVLSQKMQTLLAEKAAAEAVEEPSAE